MENLTSNEETLWKGSVGGTWKAMESWQKVSLSLTVLVLTIALVSAIVVVVLSIEANAIYTESSSTTSTTTSSNSTTTSSSTVASSIAGPPEVKCTDTLTCPTVPLILQLNVQNGSPSLSYVTNVGTLLPQPTLGFDAPVIQVSSTANTGFYFVPVDVCNHVYKLQSAANAAAILYLESNSLTSQYYLATRTAVNTTTVLDTFILYPLSGTSQVLIGVPWLPDQYLLLLSNGLFTMNPIGTSFVWSPAGC